MELPTVAIRSGRRMGRQNRSLRRQLSSVGTDYASWGDERLLGIPRYNTFVSHKRSSAQDFARGLH